MQSGKGGAMTRKKKTTSADYGIDGRTTLDLPEPLRSQALASLGKTADEFAAHMLGWEESDREREEMIARGELSASNLHYDDDLMAVVVPAKDD
jgi:hypothetical protein